MKKKYEHITNAMNKSSKENIHKNAMNKSSKGSLVRYRKLRVDATQTVNAPNSLGSGHPEQAVHAVRDERMTSVIG